MPDDPRERSFWSTDPADYNSAEKKNAREVRARAAEVRRNRRDERKKR